MRIVVLTLTTVLLTACSRAQEPTSDPATTYEVDVQSDSIRARLSDEQAAVLCGGATEPPFTGKYVHHKADGVYRCAACDHILFDSGTKFESGSGWPSFYDMMDAGSVDTRPDRSYGMVRTEIVCGRCGGHLGHVFEDGPNPTGLRYCVNSASLDFVPRDSVATAE